MTGLDELANTLVDTTGAQNGKDVFATLRLEASDSQPNRVCEVTISLTSEGDDASRSVTFELEVMAVEASDSPPDSPQTDDDEGSSSLSQESNSLPWVGGIELLLLLGLASLRKQFS